MTYNDTGWKDEPARRKVWVNAGCGPRTGVYRSPLFNDWREIRVDVDPMAEPDIVADVTDLSPLRDGMADAIWSSHCMEHLFHHQVADALREFHRVIADDGFIIFLVPDVQAVASMIAADKFHETVYEAAVGPVTAHDMFYGYGPAIAKGHTKMAHRCGFTPTIAINFLTQSRFSEFRIRRLPTLELAIVARKTPGGPTNNCEALLQNLAL
jgi:SAM-dependent methyltransferase